MFSQHSIQTKAKYQKRLHCGVTTELQNTLNGADHSLYLCARATDKVRDKKLLVINVDYDNCLD